VATGRTREKVRNVFTSPSLPFPSEGDENLAELVRASLVRTLRLSRKSREEIAAGLSRRLGFEVSVNTLNSFAAESRPGHRFPLEWAAAWMRETGDYGLLGILCDALGLATPEPGSREMVEFARARLEADIAAQDAEGWKARILRTGKLPGR